MSGRSAPHGRDGRRAEPAPGTMGAPHAFPERLASGYRKFLSGRFRRESDRYRLLSEMGQKPEIMVVGCVDSRVSPEVIFDAAPGEILVVRNVANLVPRFEPDRAWQHGTSAALEFGVQALRVKHVVVLGHASCGGIRAFADEREPLSPGDFIGRWMAQIAPAADRLGPRREGEDEAYLRRLELASVELSLANLLTFPWIRSAVDSGRLALHGAFFGVAEGRLLVRDPLTGRFEAVAERLEPGSASAIAPASDGLHPPRDSGPAARTAADGAPSSDG